MTSLTVGRERKPRMTGSGLSLVLRMQWWRTQRWWKGGGGGVRVMQGIKQKHPSMRILDAANYNPKEVDM